MSDDVMWRVLAGIERIEKGQDQLRAGMGQNRADLLRTRAELMERVDRLQDALTAQHEGEIITLGVAERDERMAKSTQDEVRIR